MTNPGTSIRDINDSGFRKRFATRQLQPVTATPTHLPGLNLRCRDDGGGQGFAKGWFITIGGNPGFGKSVAGLNLAAAALRHGESVGYVSLEMTVGQVAARYYAIQYGVPIAKLERGGFDPVVWGELEARCNGVPPLWVPGGILSEGRDVGEFIRNCYAKGCRWFVIDYLQLIQVGDEDSINRAITRITTDLRAWAADHGATIVALSQFNRTTSAEYRLRPRSQGLYGGTILEASSDMVLLLDHSRYERDATNSHLARTWLIIDKNRHGPLAEIPVLWDYRTLAMREGLEDEVSDWPK